MNRSLYEIWPKLKDESLRDEYSQNIMNNIWLFVKKKKKKKKKTRFGIIFTSFPFFLFRKYNKYNYFFISLSLIKVG